jgi:hypothetical protein
LYPASIRIRNRIDGTVFPVPMSSRPPGHRAWHPCHRYAVILLIIPLIIVVIIVTSTHHHCADHPGQQQGQQQDQGQQEMRS